MAKKTAARKTKKAAKRAVKRAAPTRAQAARKAGTRTARAKAGAKRARRRAAPKTAAPSERNVVVVVGDSSGPAMRKVASQLKSRGMNVDTVLEATGLITGTYGKATSNLSRIKGVTGVEETAPIQLPPPESDTQ